MSIGTSISLDITIAILHVWLGVFVCASSPLAVEMPICPSYPGCGIWDVPPSIPGPTGDSGADFIQADRVFLGAVVLSLRPSQIHTPSGDSGADFDRLG